MQRTNIYLDEDQIQTLKHLAVEDRRTVADLVREAVDGYLARRLAEDPTWHERFDRLIARIRSRIPATIPQEEIEADIAAARAEVREARRALRERGATGRR